MSRKQNQKDSSGFIFDLQSNTVLAQGGTFENMKEKINAVRAIVPNKSNNEIILVLQHFDNCVDKTVQAFMEGSASEVLKEWTVTGKKKVKITTFRSIMLIFVLFKKFRFFKIFERFTCAFSIYLVKKSFLV